MKPENALVAFAASLGALIMIEKFYHHPTYGNGLRALYAAAKAALAFG